MLTQKEKQQIREQIFEQLQNFPYAGFEVEGVITDGILLYHAEKDAYVVIKPIVKQESFDAEDALAEYQEKLKNRIERELKKAEKLAKEKVKKEEKQGE